MHAPAIPSAHGRAGGGGRFMRASAMTTPSVSL
ncbi:hypothetical protein GXY_12743 [Novacetimonas hansenii ATCC 23769]|uniref:Uncharacterized protein n=1 Tax=Novacetimonas hansenii ATCC 23769 TaxID=714995 RepID=D5QH59_NOVHA|nr:hypothetical protein GXY_12743 [Novacetimonas hansenii ATCC 23769]